jgi:hypothetical protein
VAQVNQLRAECQRMNIPGNWMTCDRTGPGTGVHDGLRETWDMGVRGINWSEGASETKILEEDKYNACDEYADLPSEMWFALRRWLEFTFFLISPHVQTARLFSELSRREYRLGSKGPEGMGRMLVESKRDFKLRNKGKSPDFADACVMLLHGCRMNTRERSPMPGLTRAPERRKPVLAGPSPWPGPGKHVSIAEN